MSTTSAPSALYSTDDLSTYLGVPVRTLEDWRLRGVGPAFIRIGKHVKYRAADIEVFLDAHTVRTGA